MDVVPIQAGTAPAARDVDSVLYAQPNRPWLETSLGLLTSIVVHLLLLVALALLFHVVPKMQRPAEIVLAPPGLGDAEIDGVITTDSSVAVELPSETNANPDVPTITEPDINEVATVPPKPELLFGSNSPIIDPPTPSEQPSDAATAAANLPNLSFQSTDALRGRIGERKRQLLGEAGGSEGSERAVQMALAWLAQHQEADGSWQLDFQAGDHCGGQCGNPGSKAPAKNAATALALLAFLGNGQTHRDGPYAEVVAFGLEYLVKNQRDEGIGGSYMDEGQMYSHGLATIALCEALAMTQDQSLFIPARNAVEFIVAAQNESQGGWRYRPGEMGDTTVTGWQLMALKTASMSYIDVPPAAIRKAWGFIDSVELPTRYQYAYQSGGRYEKQKRAVRRSERYLTTSAVALLTRMYLGWHKSNPVLGQGIEWLAKRGPNVDRRKCNLYFNYYATQIMRHWGGEPWHDWNEEMREFLIETQMQTGHQAGSWFFAGAHNEAGGRLYCTALATLILEVYYRHLPLYSQRAVALREGTGNREQGTGEED